jgi:hypothetical protein
MNTAMPVQQRGLSFGGFIFVAFILVFAAILMLKLIPAYVQNAQIKSVFNEIVHDASVDKTSPREIRKAFDRRSAIDDIKAIKAEDIEIAGDGTRLDLSASYSVKIPLFANASIVLEFNPSSD